MGGDPRKQACVPVPEGVLHPLDHVGPGKDAGSAHDHGLVSFHLVQAVPNPGDGVGAADYFLVDGVVAEAQRLVQGFPPDSPIHGLQNDPRDPEAHGAPVVRQAHHERAQTPFIPSLSRDQRKPEAPSQTAKTTCPSAPTWCSGCCQGTWAANASSPLQRRRWRWLWRPWEARWAPRPPRRTP